MESRRSRRKKGLAPEISVDDKDQAAPQMPKPHDGFTAEDIDFLAMNENVRYAPNSKLGRVGHAVFVTMPDGSKAAYQFALPSGNALEIIPLKNIQPIVRYGALRYQAESLDGRKLYARRFTKAKINLGAGEEEAEIAYFSDPDKPDKEPFFGGTKSTELFRTDMEEQEQAEFDAEINAIPVVTKGGNEMIVDPESVRLRDQNKKRTPDQNTVMGESACDAFAGFLECFGKELTPEARVFFRKAIEAPLRDAIKSNDRPEWLHLEGFSLTPVSKDPQRKDNLGAAPKWSNTTMMVLERLAKWFALNRPTSHITIKPLFTMLLDSELVKDIHFEVGVREQGRQLTFIQDIDPFKRYPLPPKASDLAQITGISYHILNGIIPAQIDKLVGAPIQAPVQNSSLAHFFKQPATPAPVNVAPPVALPVASPAPLPAPLPAKGKRAGQPESHFEFDFTSLYESSVIQILMTMKDYDYDQPWCPPVTSNHRGSGLVVKHNSKIYVLTNAHCIENTTIMRVRRANDKKKYPAKIVSRCYQSDLALLEVNDPEFQQLVKPVEIGGMVSLRDYVQTVGFPMGGSEISISEGIVSRTEVQDYVMSGHVMLQTQVDAAINPGNSGGPVFSREGKLIGIAFQGYDGHQGLGYMIPAPIIKHFLTEAFAGKKVPVFPILPIRYQLLENPSLRKHYQMTPEQSGIRISKVQKLGDASTKLKKDDIILAIDGHSLSNDGRTDIPGIGRRIDFHHLLHMKYLGETVNVTLLRKNQETQQPEIHHVDVKLEFAPDQAEIMGVTEHDKMPTYYMVSGVVFCPLTPNYALDGGHDFENVYSLSENCKLEDMAKKFPDQEKVVLHTVMEHAITEGYDGYGGLIVKKVNGEKIKNLRHLISVIENSRGDHIFIEFGNKVMSLPRMTPKELRDLLNDNHIPYDRSEDLRQQPEPQVIAQMELDVVNPDDAGDDEISLGQMDSHYSDEDDFEFDGAQRMSLGSDEDDIGEDIDYDKEGINPKKVSPGTLTFLATLSALDGRAKAGEFNNEDDVILFSDEELNDKKRGRRDSYKSADVIPMQDAKKRLRKRGPGLFDNSLPPANSNANPTDNTANLPAKKGYGRK